MTQWEVVGVIVTLVGLFFTVAKPIINLNSSITRLTILLDELKKDVDNLGEKSREHDSKLLNHETRISILEAKDEENNR